VVPSEGKGAVRRGSRRESVLTRKTSLRGIACHIHAGGFLRSVDSSAEHSARPEGGVEETETE
jgi:hypothetical protein